MHLERGQLIWCWIGMPFLDEHLCSGALRTWGHHTAPPMWTSLNGAWPEILGLNSGIYKHLRSSFIIMWCYGLITKRPWGPKRYPYDTMTRIHRSCVVTTEWVMFIAVKHPVVRSCTLGAWSVGLEYCLDNFPQDEWEALKSSEIFILPDFHYNFSLGQCLAHPTVRSFLSYHRTATNLEVKGYHILPLRHLSLRLFKMPLILWHRAA